MMLVHSKEKPLFFLLAFISALFWLALLIGTRGKAILWLGAFYLAYLFVQSGFIAYLRGFGVRISANQFPDLFARVNFSVQQLQMTSVPDAYLLPAHRAFSALATRFLGREFLVLYSDVIEALEDSPEAINFYIGHELGRLSRGHLAWALFLMPAGVLPLFGAAYSRSREYTCDLHGLVCCPHKEMALVGMAALAAGGQRSKQMNISAYAEQLAMTRGFWMSLHELIADTPWLVKRVERIQAVIEEREPRLPKVNPLAFLFALLVPRTGLGVAGTAFSAVFMFIVVGTLVALAVPAYQDFLAREQVYKAVEFGSSVKKEVEAYYLANKELPETNEDLHWVDDVQSPGVATLFVEGGTITVLLDHDIARVGDETVVFVPSIADDGSVQWSCVEGTLAQRYRPSECRGSRFATTKGGSRWARAFSIVIDTLLNY